MAKKKSGKNRPGAGAKPKPAPAKSSLVEKPRPAKSEEKPPKVVETSEPAVDRDDDGPSEEERDDEPVAAAASRESAAATEPPLDLAPKSKAKPPLRRAAWGKPFATIERWWTWLELRILVGVVVGLIASMVFWVVLQGLSSPIESNSKAGVIVRAIIGLVAFGAVTWWAAGKAKLSRFPRTIAAMAAMAVGAAIAPSWRSFGVVYFGNVLNWLQEGSSFTMFGQLRGVSTRLTVVLAFIGGSLAAASGKHINIDVALRFIPSQPRTKPFRFFSRFGADGLDRGLDSLHVLARRANLRMIVFTTQSIATIAVCLVAAWGFFDYIAIWNFDAKAEATAGEKYDVVDKAVAQDLFLLRRQLVFDLKAAPYVLGGKPSHPEEDPSQPQGAKWDDERGFNGRQWNEMLEKSGYRDHFTAEEIEALKAPEDALDDSRLPLAIGPQGQPRNLLVRTMNLTFAAGFVFMALRFLLRMILVLSGHQSAEAEEEFDPDADPERHHEREEVALAAAHETSTKEVD